MKQFFISIGYTLFFTINALAQEAYQVSIDLRKVTNDRVHVTIQTPKVSQSTIAFHLPKIVPGTYAIHNYGAFVSTFKAVDKLGNTLATEHPDVNTWIIKDAAKLFSVSYEVNDTWDSPEIKEDIFEPSGTNIQADSFFVLNTFGFIGYLANYENRSYTISIHKPNGLYGSSSLSRSPKSTATTDYFETKSYHVLADAPIMYCQPDTAWLKIGNTSVLVSVFWQGKSHIAQTLLNDIRPVLEAHRKYFDGKLPVKKYAFLVHFSNKKNLTRFGALEHNQSCFTFLPAGLPAEQQSVIFRDIAAHEFLHIITPLHIHSEEIEHFDYINAKMSKHLWLYEGLTEYAAHYAQLRGGLIDLPAYLNRQAQKIENARTQFNDTLPFTELSLGALDKYKSQYQNVYEKGALIGLCLDVLLLKNSNGRYGVRQLLQDLSKQYGPEKSFKDDELFDKIAALTGPAVREFFSKYVEGGQPLPLAETFASLGINYNPSSVTKDVEKAFTFGMSVAADKKTLLIATLQGATDLAKRLGLKIGDTLVSLNGMDFNLSTYEQCFNQYTATVQLGDTVTFVVKRKNPASENQTIALRADIREVTKSTIRIEPLEKPSAYAMRIRLSWMGLGDK